MSGIKNESDPKEKKDKKGLGKKGQEDPSKSKGKDSEKKKKNKDDPQIEQYKCK